MTRIYVYMTKSKGRAGCANFHWRMGEYESKAALRRANKSIWGSTVITDVLTAEEFKARYSEATSDELVRMIARIDNIIKER